MAPSRSGIARAVSIAALLLIAGGGRAQATTFTIAATVDQYVYTTEGPAGGASVSASELSPSDAAYSYYKFNLGAIPVGDVALSATLHLYAIAGHEASAIGRHDVFALDNHSWDPAILDWNHQPVALNTASPLSQPAGVTYQSTTLVNASAAPGYYTWDVTAGVNGSAGLGNGDRVLALLLAPRYATGANFGIHIARAGYNAGEGAYLTVDAVPGVPEPAALSLAIAGAALLRLRRTRP